MKAIPIEGNRMLLDGGGMFGHTPKALWEKWYPVDDRNRIQIATRCLLLQTDSGQNILFETGLGTFLEPKLRERYGVEEGDQLLINLEKLGVREQDVDAVVLSHLHFDHAGGLLLADRLRFPKATYFVGKRHWEVANSPHVREKASFIVNLQPLLRDSGRLQLVEGITHPQLPPEVSFHYSDGHTVGLMLGEIAMPDGPLLFASDLVPGTAWLHLPTVTGYDRFPELLIDEKKQLLQSIYLRGGSIVFTHDPVVVQSKLLCDQNGKFSPKDN